jgi:hypothetical protein
MTEIRRPSLLIGVVVAALIGLAPTAQAGTASDFDTPDIVWWGVPLPIEGTIIPPFTENVTFDVPAQLVGADCEVFAVNDNHVWVGNTAYVSTGAFAHSATSVEDTAGRITPLGSATAGPTVTVGIGFAPSRWFVGDGSGGMTAVGGFADLSVRFECDVTPRPPPPPTEPAVDEAQDVVEPPVAVDPVPVEPQYVG